MATTAEYQREWRKKNKRRSAEIDARAAGKRKADPARQCKYLDYQKKYRHQKQRLIRYGLTPEEFKVMLKRQRSKCLICKDKFKNNLDQHVDHCHKTGIVRGILCRSCNHLLGNAKDDIKILTSAQNYLKKFSKIS